MKRFLLAVGVAACAFAAVGFAACGSDCFTDECYERHCDGDNCVETSLLKTYECAEEICVNHMKQLVTDVSKCATSDLCLVPMCVFESDTYKCDFEKKVPTDPDPCSNYTCDPNTGTFEQSPKCWDSDPCTQDICLISGECRFVPVDCSQEVTPMECFVPYCVPTPDGDRYKCKQKIIPDCTPSDSSSDSASAGSTGSESRGSTGSSGSGSTGSSGSGSAGSSGSGKTGSSASSSGGSVISGAWSTHRMNLAFILCFVLLAIICAAN